uniref:Uncharacterized protein n=1 Tax=Timema monikensis TaxID=170555 RepID=A0A7R9E4C1_9NEOP|nr:unnamed protein product [Timema monikensis]
MDLLYNYLPDMYSYQSMRHPAYDNASLQDNKRKERTCRPSGALLIIERRGTVTSRLAHAYTHDLGLGLYGNDGGICVDKLKSSLGFDYNLFLLDVACILTCFTHSSVIRVGILTCLTHSSVIRVGILTCLTHSSDTGGHFDLLHTLLCDTGGHFDLLDTLLCDTDSYRGNANQKVPACGSKSSKGNCPICQEKQRRPLANYIRSKSTQDRKKETSICEEEEEEEATSSKDQQGAISQPK